VDFLIDFVKIYTEGVYHLWPIFISLLGIIIALGFRIGRLEGWHPADAVYYALVASTSLGSSAFHPTRRRSKWLTVAISFTGVLFVGLIVAIGLEAVAHAFHEVHRGALPLAP
jgi:hypothetical protein